MQHHQLRFCAIRADNIENDDDDDVENIFWNADPLLGNNAVYIFPPKRTLSTIGRPLLGKGSLNNPQQ
jgi:hypothetical protein